MLVLIGIIFLVFLWGTQLTLRFPFFGISLRGRDIRSFFKTVWLVGGITIFLWLSYQTTMLYGAWKADALGQYFLPPHNTVWYFVWYVFSRFWAPWVISLGAALLGKKALEVMNKRNDERFFEAEEPWLFALAIFFVGYPGFLFYGIVLGFAALLWTLLFYFLKKGRAPLYFLWLPCALFAILITYYLLPEEILLNFNL